MGDWMNDPFLVCLAQFVAGELIKLMLLLADVLIFGSMLALGFLPGSLPARDLRICYVNFCPDVPMDWW